MSKVEPLTLMYGPTDPLAEVSIAQIAFLIGILFLHQLSQIVKVKVFGTLAEVSDQILRCDETVMIEI